MRGQIGTGEFYFVTFDLRISRKTFSAILNSNKPKITSLKTQRIHSYQNKEIIAHVHWTHAFGNG